MTASDGRADGAEPHVTDALSPGRLALAVGASVVGTVIVASLGTSRVAALAGAVISPVISAIFTTRRTGLPGNMRAGAVAILALVAVLITVVGFTVPEAVAGKSLINGQRTTFPMPVEGDCENGLDDDVDGLIDAADPGCQDGRTVEKSEDPTTPTDGGESPTTPPTTPTTPTTATTPSPSPY
jgi:hypothetical protein